nr:RNA 3'-phosphate cyclase [Anaerolineae bacterium]
MLIIDGATGEGGGQVIRTALAMSILTQTPIKIVNARARRRNKGLAPQHLAGVQAAAAICQGKVEGCFLRSTTFTFEPATPARPDNYTFDISKLAERGSAGAVTLLLQGVLLPLALANGPSRLILRGGTHVAWSPPYHYLEWVLLPILRRVGIDTSIRLKNWGWYPRGGGEVEVTVSGRARLRGIDLSQRGSFCEITGIAAASNLPSHIPERISNCANNLLGKQPLPAAIQAKRISGPSTGAGLFAALRFENASAGFSALGTKGKPSEEVAREAIADLLRFYQHNAALDRYLPDQLLTTLALAAGPSTLSTIELIRHTTTNAQIVKRFVDRDISIEGQIGTPGQVHIQ